MSKPSYDINHREGYGGPSVEIVTAIYKNRLLEKVEFTDRGSAGYALAKIEAKWNARTDLDELLDTFPLASPWCTNCGSDTLGGRTSVGQHLLCKKCRHLIPEIQAEAQAKDAAAEAERKAKRDRDRSAALAEAESGFHWRDGWFFKRDDNGSVRVSRVENHPEGRVGYPDILTIPENEWASIVCSVSALGETGERWMAAREFHGLPAAASRASAPPEGRTSSTTVKEERGNG